MDWGFASVSQATQKVTQTNACVGASVRHHPIGVTADATQRSDAMSNAQRGPPMPTTPLARHQPQPARTDAPATALSAWVPVGAPACGGPPEGKRRPYRPLYPLAMSNCEPNGIQSFRDRVLLRAPCGARRPEIRGYFVREIQDFQVLLGSAHGQKNHPN